MDPPSGGGSSVSEVAICNAIGQKLAKYSSYLVFSECTRCIWLFGRSMLIARWQNPEFLHAFTVFVIQGSPHSSAIGVNSSIYSTIGEWHYTKAAFFLQIGNVRMTYH